jgi:hypothetical protein
MIEVKDRSTGEVHRGRCPSTIAHRIYGRRAWVKLSPDPNNPWQAEVLTPVKGDTAYNIEASWYLDQAARQAEVVEMDRADPSPVW